MSIAAVIITKNEEVNIGPCLQTVDWADERIVVDACSSDRTVEVATTASARVFIRPWPGYGPQKNFAMDQTKAEWILVVDADERITDALREEILSVLRAGPASEIGGFEIPRRNFFYGRWIRRGGMSPDYQIRLFRRSAARYDDLLLHERLQIRGTIEKLTQPMDHHSMPTVKHHVRKMMRYTTLGSQEKLKTHRHVSAVDLAGNHLGTILKTFVMRRGYEDGVAGVIVALFAGMHTFVKYAKAWETLNVKSNQ